MLQFTPWKQATILVICLLGLLIVLPNFFSQQTLARWPVWVPKKQINLGLDLRGGAHLLYAMEVNDVRKDWLDNLREDARKRLRDAKIPVSAVGITGNAVQVRHRQGRGYRSGAEVAEGRSSSRSATRILGTSGPDVEVAKGEGGSLTIAPTEAGLKQRIGGAIDAAIETVRRRVDATGHQGAQHCARGRPAASSYKCRAVRIRRSWSG